MQMDNKWKGAAQISAVYKKALKDPTAARAVAERALVAAESPEDAARVAVQLQALQVMQNQRIIELLEKKK